MASNLFKRDIQSGGIERITKSRFYYLGGLSHPRLFRKAASSGAWQHFHDRRY